MTDGLRRYKTILQLTKGHLTVYRTDGDIPISRGSKFREAIAPLFQGTKRRGVETALRPKWTMYRKDRNDS